MIRFLSLLFVAVAAGGQSLPADSTRGAQLFESEHCIECHIVNGRGARTAPDLGRMLDREFTPAKLVSTMWNHAPAMWGAMRTRKIQTSGVDDQAAADLFAYFYSTRFFEKPGDAGRGKRLFTERACGQCHGISDVKNPSALPVSQWQSLGDSVTLTAAMWNHSAAMGKELLRKDVKWPQLNGQDLTDLLVYLRNLPATKNFASSFVTTDGAKGKELFEQKGCMQCHRAGGSPITWRLKGKTLTSIAAQMWDHGLRMPAATIHLEPGEMREILSYVWAAQFFESDGDEGRGKRVFASKRCTACHDSGSSGAPSLTGSRQRFSEIRMVSVLWRHGPNMLALMTERKIPWPRFEAREMSDLIAYLNKRE